MNKIICNNCEETIADGTTIEIDENSSEKCPYCGAWGTLADIN